MLMVLEVYVTEIGGSMQTLRFSRSPVRIGRNQLNDIPLEDPFVSEWHGAIRFDDHSISYSDMGSTNGSMLDGKRLTKNVSAPLSDLSRLVLGRRELMVARVAGEASDAIRPSPPLGASTTPMPPTVLSGEAVSDRPAPRRPGDSGINKTLGWGDPVPALAKPASGGASLAAAELDALNRTRLGLAEEAKVIVELGTTPGASSASRSPDEMRRPQAATSPAAPRSVPRADAPPAPSTGSSQSLTPAPLHSADDATLERQRKLLEAFAEAFVGLRKGYEQFGSEVGVRTVNGTTPLHRARSSREVLAHMLSPSVDAGRVARDMIGIFADFGIHHIAMMEGITQGVRSVLQSLDPRANNLEVSGGLFSGGKNKARWNEYLERFDQLITDDEQLHIAIFGEEFAHAYASVTLGGGSKPPRGQGE
jgi:type VI secretion system protein ImpI